ncbi:alpha/beta-hydrolase [Alternaria alternata]|uniref:Alpha/beta-hydrolase n=1 Tax=Alternaria alternata TaxID=5599 RepID=A0A177DPA4_ALTAL|nr:alpha/beta-hydrolase [Alternaria alternata]OAG21774.1 alpha/beta-hydrolase [Alternaria alternata]
MTKPVFLFFPGAWHSTDFFDKVVGRLEHLGYQCVAIQLPSVGRVPPITDLDEDIAVIRSAVLKELDAGRNVVTNAHSYAGIPVSSALHGLGTIARQRAGLLGGVVKLTYITSFITSEGTSLLDIIGGLPNEWVDGNVSFQADLVDRLYHDVPRQEAEEMIAALQPHALGALQGKMKSPAAWREIPVAYMVCEEDRALPAGAQDAMIQGVKAAGADVVIERVAASHSPYLSQPDTVVKFLLRAAGEVVDQ